MAGTVVNLKEKDCRGTVIYRLVRQRGAERFGIYVMVCRAELEYHREIVAYRLRSARSALAKVLAEHDDTNRNPTRTEHA